MDPWEALAKTRSIQPLTPKARAKRSLLAARDGGMRCAYCKRHLPPEKLVLEHVVPRSRQGPDALFNRALSCPPCDAEKSDRTPQEWQPGKTWGVKAIDEPTKKRRKDRTKPEMPQRPREEAERVGTRRRPMSTAQKDALARGSIAYCATCQRMVSLKKPHPDWHLLLSDDTYEPGH